MPRQQKPGQQRKTKPAKKSEVKHMHYLLRPARTGRDAVLERTPELRPLADMTVTVFGTGALGAPSALELARAGVGELRLVDPDHVDPATAARWPLGLATAGLPKVEVLSDFIAANYPQTRVVTHRHHVGGVRNPPAADDKAAPPADTHRSHLDLMAELLDGASLVYDATAELGVQHLLSDLCLDAGLPYVGIAGRYGGWGGHVVRILPDRVLAREQGCWMCFCHALMDGTIPEPPYDPAGEVQPVGCADPTFTGSGFDLQQVVLAGVRCVASTLCQCVEGGYPPQDWDVLTLALRDGDGRQIPPTYTPHHLAPHPQCSRCGTAVAGGDGNVG